MASRTLRRSLALAGTAFILSTSAVFADDISNSLDASIDAIAEVMPLNVGGSSGTTSLYLQPRNGDGKNGCNITGPGAALGLSVASSSPAVATVSPTTVTFGSCGDTHVLTVSPLSAGSATISVSLTSNNTGGTFNLAPATFEVTVAPPPNTAPTVAVTGVTGGAAYEIGAVPAAGCSVEDAEDGDSTFAATLSPISGPLAAFGLGGQTASCSYTDGGGLTASASITYSIVDTGAPTIALLTRTPAANADGWNNSDVTVTWSCSDHGSGAVDATVSVTLTAEAAGQSATGTCVDNAGNTASATQAGISIDKTAPTISDDGPTGVLGTNPWYVSEVSNTFTASDGLSGVAGTNPVSPSTGSAEGTGITVNSGPFSDLAGNSTPGIDSAAFAIDLSDPTDVAFSSLLAGSYIFGSVPPAPTCTATDAVSGLAGCDVTGYSTLVGTHELLATATDNAGRTATVSATYTVLPWTLNGFYRPVDMDSVLNIVRGGATVPLKFQVFAGSTELTEVSSIASFRTLAISCSTQLGLADEIEIESTGGTSLRYDASGGQFIQNWQTPRTSGVCYRATTTTLDGSSLTAYFRTK